MAKNENEVREVNEAGEVEEIDEMKETKETSEVKETNVAKKAKEVREEVDSSKLKYRGRIRQIPIYLGKLFSMFVFLNDWKVIPLAAFIAILVSIVIKSNFGLTMEGTVKGSLAVTCIALWNGFFNSIQVVCRERSIIKREHRSGMHITSYIFAHMVYQAFLCVIQTITTIAAFAFTGVAFRETGIVNSFVLDFAITIFLITYAADMLSLFISCLAKNTTSAMTVMPLVLMVQLIFSGSLFGLPKSLDGLSKVMISNHGTAAVSALVDYNNLPSTAGWNMIKKVSKNTDDEQLKLTIEQMELAGYDDRINAEVAKSNAKEDYVGTQENLKYRWRVQIAFALLFAMLSVVSLEFIDKDRR